MKDMLELMNYLTNAGEQLELARQRYLKIKDSEIMMTEEGKQFAGHLGGMIKESSLACLAGCSILLELRAKDIEEE